MVMLIRRFTTSSRCQAFTRTRYAAKPASKPASNSTLGAGATKPAAASASSPSSRTTASPSGSALNNATNASNSGSGGASGTGSAVNAAKPSGSAPSFTPRLVPELKTQPTSTRVQEVIDPDAFVNNSDHLEFNEDTIEPSTDWTTSYQGLGSAPFDSRVVDTLLAPIVVEDVEITPDGLLYLPEIKYRRILNRAFGPGGWGIAPRTKTMVTQRQVTREYALICLGRLVSVSRGEMDYFSAEGITTAMEGCKSNALMRCCKDLGIASELWDPTFIRSFKSKYCDTKFFEKKRRFVWKRKDRAWEYPYV